MADQSEGERNGLPENVGTAIGAVIIILVFAMLGHAMLRSFL